jgi:hypothetical protein
MQPFRGIAIAPARLFSGKSFSGTRVATCKTMHRSDGLTGGQTVDLFFRNRL